ncbi:protein-glutamine gamma-glutamyltransferase K-like protein [Leptotrombidium deliense]|uniref:Protein-glutamine gamma-glutamyltransferase K-like protein n=1 Tax=Leptotrombidium deliense TaxID=299467 RepID=A0A443RWI6_9ACAR|nr:protein-glutamine gamma-glutamyltransferase K-like protein [Leptotrombidium deliense]
MATKDYITKLADQRTIVVDASAIVGNETYHVVERFTLHSPKLEITAPSTVKRNTVFNVTVNFRNPLKQTLTNCSLIVEGKGFRRKIFTISDVSASAMSKTTLKLSTSRVNIETFVIKLYTQSLKESVGFAQVKVSGKPVHRFLC